MKHKSARKTIVSGRTNYKLGAKPNLMPYGAIIIIIISLISPIRGETIQGGEIPPIARSRCRNSNALAFGERAMST